MTLFELLEVDLEKRIVEVKVSSNFDYILKQTRNSIYTI